MFELFELENLLGLIAECPKGEGGGGTSLQEANGDVSHFDDWIHYHGLELSIESLEWGRTFSVSSKNRPKYTHPF